jgi:hypothetical protein
VAPLLSREQRLVLTDDENGALARLAAADPALRGFELALLEGGLAAWRASGLPMETGLGGALCALDDAGHLPWEMEADPIAAMQAYIDWELQLPAQLARDGLLAFRPLARA